VISHEVTVPELELQKLSLISDILRHPEMGNLIDEGYITFGMVKPQANEGKDLQGFSDDGAANVILTEIDQKSGLDIVLELPLMFTKEQVNQFYGGNRERFQQLGIWDDFVSYTTENPMTAVVLYDPEGNAVPNWRKAIGSTTPDPLEDSIRGRHADPEKLPNNLVHGSGSSEEAKVEIGIIAGMVESLHKKLQEDSQKAPSLENLGAQAGVPKKEVVLYAVRRPDEVGNGYDVVSQDRKIKKNTDNVRLEHTRRALSEIQISLNYNTSPKSEGL
jgi:nucleoside diphosphate kinase